MEPFYLTGSQWFSLWLQHTRYILFITVITGWQIDFHKDSKWGELMFPLIAACKQMYCTYVDLKLCKSFWEHTHFFTSPPPTSWPLIRCPPSHRASPVSCGGPCSTPGPLSLELFSLFFLGSYVWSSCDPPPSASNKRCGTPVCCYSSETCSHGRPAPGQPRALCIHENSPKNSLLLGILKDFL